MIWKFYYTKLEILFFNLRIYFHFLCSKNDVKRHKKKVLLTQLVFVSHFVALNFFKFFMSLDFLCHFIRFSTPRRLFSTSQHSSWLEYPRHSSTTQLTSLLKFLSHFIQIFSWSCCFFFLPLSIRRRRRNFTSKELQWDNKKKSWRRRRKIIGKIFKTFLWLLFFCYAMVEWVWVWNYIWRVSSTLLFSSPRPKTTITTTNS